MPTGLCFHLNPKLDLFRFGRIEFEDSSQFTVGQRDIDASIPFDRDRSIGINFLSFRLQINMGTRKMTAMKPELINIKSRTADVSYKNLNRWNQSVMQKPIIIANELLAIALFKGYFASFLTIIKNDPKADEGYQDRKTRKPFCNGHFGFLNTVIISTFWR